MQDRRSGVYYADGQPITLGGGQSFTFGNSTGSGFNSFVFFGGINTSGATANFGPGMYVLAGSNPGVKLFDTGTNTQITGGSPTGSGGSPDAGRFFLLTDATYSWTDSSGATRNLANVATGIGLPLNWSLGFGDASFKAGNNPGSSVKLQGLRPDISTNVPDELETFGQLVIWQDQRNSNVVYNSAGQIYTGACAGGGTGTINNPCTRAYSESRGLEIEAGSKTAFDGVIYQPRGAWTTIWATSQYRGPLRIVTGQMILGGNSVLTLNSPTVPITTLTAALVE